jgi:hypothetical protein
MYFFPPIYLLHDENIIFSHNSGTEERGPLTTLACLIHIFIFNSKCSLSSIHVLSHTPGKTKFFNNELIIQYLEMLKAKICLSLSWFQKRKPLKGPCHETFVFRFSSSSFGIFIIPVPFRIFSKSNIFATHGTPPMAMCK